MSAQGWCVAGIAAITVMVGSTCSSSNTTRLDDVREESLLDEYDSGLTSPDGIGTAGVVGVSIRRAGRTTLTRTSPICSEPTVSPHEVIFDAGDDPTISTEVAVEFNADRADLPIPLRTTARVDLNDGRRRLLRLEECPVTLVHYRHRFTRVRDGIHLLGASIAGSLTCSAKGESMGDTELLMSFVLDWCTRLGPEECQRLAEHPSMRE